MTEPDPALLPVAEAPPQDDIDRKICDLQRFGKGFTGIYPNRVYVALDEVLLIVRAASCAPRTPAEPEEAGAIDAFLEHHRSIECENARLKAEIAANGSQVVFVVVLQPDGDWDHQADFLGVYATREEAEAQKARFSRERVQITECHVGESVWDRNRHG